VTAALRREIGVFCKTGSGGTPTRTSPEFFDSGTIPWIKSGELKSRYVSCAEELITEAAIRKSSAKLVPAGALLVAMYGATVGDVAQLVVPAATNQAVCHLLPDPEVCDSGYLFHFLKANRSRLLAKRVGGGQPNISQGILRSLEVPLPPLGDQRRIAAILDKADALRTKRREAIAKLDQLQQSVFVDLFGDPIENERKWPEGQTLGDISDIVSGITKGRRTSEVTREVPYLAVANVQDRHLKLATLKTIHATEAEIAKYRLMTNDLLLTEGGDPDKLGRGALWNGSIEKCIHQNHVFRVRVTSDVVDPVYLNWLVGSARGKRYFVRAAKQTTGIASINMTQLRRFPLLMPPIELQRQFARMVSAIGKQHDRMNMAAKSVDEAFSSLQHLAFGQEL